MNYKQFIKRIMDDTGLLREDAEVAGRLVFGTVRKILLTGDEVSIPVLGTLYLRTSKPRKEWKNPGTGELQKRKEGVKLKFRPSRKFENLLTNKLLNHHPKSIDDMSDTELEEYLMKDD